MAGLAAGYYMGWPWPLWAALAAVGLAASLRWEASLLLSVLALGGWLTPPPPPLPQSLELSADSTVTFRAVISDVIPRTGRADIRLQILWASDSRLESLAALWRFDPRRRDSRSLPPSSYRQAAFSPGDTLTLQARLELPRTVRNPAGFDQQSYLWTRDIQLLLRRPVRILEIRPPGEAFHLARSMYRARGHIITRLERWLGQPEAGLAAGLLLGDKSGLDAEFRTRITAAGAAHLLAVSGLHVGFVALILAALAALVRLGRYGRLLFTGLGLLGYVLLTGAPPSVVRATLMALLYLWSLALEREPNPWNILAAAAIIGLLIRPADLFSPSFQLSFSAVAGIIHLYPRLKAALAATRLGTRLFSRRALRFMITLVLVSLAAQAGTLPAVLYYFHALPVYALLANLFIVPLAGLVVAGGIIALASAPFSGAVALIFANAIWLLLNLMKVLLEVPSQLPYTLLVTGRPSVGFLLLMVAALAAGPYLFRFGRRRPFHLTLGTLLLVNVMVWRSALSERALTVTFLDVGQGDATHIALPDGRHMLVDAGIASPRFDAGRLVVTPYLRGQGISSIHAAVYSHPHSDHIGGFVHLLRHFRVGEIWDIPHRHRNRLVTILQALTDSLHIPVRRLTAGAAFNLGNVDLSILAPDSLAAANSSNLNDASLVIKLRYGETSLLLMGDVGGSSERRLLAYGDALRSRWLKVGHHGSKTSTSPALLELVQPQGAVISVGRNPYGHPAEEVVRRLEAAVPQVHRTDKSGALVLRSDGHEWRVVQWR